MKLLDKEEFRQLFENSQTSYSYGCVMLDTNFELFWEEQALILEDDLYRVEEKFGKEDQPHCTILYGLKDTEFDHKLIVQLLTNLQPIEFTFTNVSLFENSEDYDVVKFDVDSPALVQLNDAFNGLPNESTFPLYHPHITLAYVKKGAGKKYLKTILQESYISDIITYSPSEGDDIRYMLTGTTPAIVQDDSDVIKN